MKKYLLLCISMLLLVNIVLAGNIKVEDDKFSIECNQKEYKVIIGTSYAYCSITNKLNSNKDVNLDVVFEKEFGVKVGGISYLNSSEEWESLNTEGKEKDVDGNKWKGKKVLKHIKKGDSLDLRVELVVDSLTVHDEFWIFLESAGDYLELDPAVTGCTNDTITLTCANGTFTGNSINTSMNILIYNATIEGNTTEANDGELLLNTSGWIKIENATLYGFSRGYLAGVGNAGLDAGDGRCDLTALGEINITNSIVDCHGGRGQDEDSAAQTAGTGGKGALLLNGSNIRVNEANMSSYGGNGGDDISGARGGSGNQGNLTILADSLFINITNTTANGGDGGVGDGGCIGCGAGGSGNIRFEIIGNSDIYQANIFLNGGDRGNLGGGTPADAGQTFANLAALNLLFFNTTYEADPGSGGAPNSSTNLSIRKKLMLDFNTNLSASSPLASELNFTNASADEYLLGHFNSSGIQDAITVYCAKTGILKIGNDTTFDTDFTIDGSCGSVSYITYAVFITDNRFDVTFNMLNESTDAFVVNNTLGIASTLQYLDEGIKKNISCTTAFNNMTCTLPADGSSIITNITTAYEYLDTQFTYEAFQINLSTQSTTINLYVTDGTSQVIFNVKDSFDNNLADIHITIEKYDIGTNTFKAVEILKTDTLGNAVGRIVLFTEWYRFTLKLNGEVKLIDGPAKVLSTTKNFRINLIGGDWYDEYDQYKEVTFSLTFNNGTKVFSLFYDDPGLNIDEACLRVMERNISGNIELSDTCSSSQSGSILYDVGDNTTTIDKTYVGTAYIKIGADEFMLDVLEVSFDTGWNIYIDKDKNYVGVFMTMLFVIALVFMGSWSPSVAIIMGLLGVGIMRILGIYRLSWPIFITLVILGGITIIRLNNAK